MLDFDKLEKEVISRNQMALESMKEAMGTAKSAVNALYAKGWKGEAQAAFAVKFAKYEKDTAVLCGHMVQLAKALNTIGQDGTHMVNEKSKAVEQTL